MKYRSTRGDETAVTFEDVLFKGYAVDGGLFVPQTIPQVSQATLQEWSHLSYSGIVKKILRMFIHENELPTHDLNNLVDIAHCSFSVPDIIPLKELDGNLFVAELFHGETFAFKDLALSVIGQMLKYYLVKRKKNTIILIGTSGDTGSAAINSVRGLDGIDIVVLYPKGFCTPIQELQMITVTDDNVYCFAAEGDSSEFDQIIKECLTDDQFVKENNLFSINSFNWARILVQIPHYFYVYFQLFHRLRSTDKLEVAVPLGAAGNLTSGCIAHVMGLPISLVLCSNANDAVAQFFSSGEFCPKGAVINTLAPAMDIQLAYNLERLVWLVTPDVDAVKKFGTDFDNSSPARICHSSLKKLKEIIVHANSYSDETIMKTIRRCYEQNSYLICPHSATGAAYHYQTQEKGQDLNDGTLRVCLATASPAKFPEAMTKSGVPPEKNAKIDNLLKLDQKFEVMKIGEDWNQILRAKIKEITRLRH